MAENKDKKVLNVPNIRFKEFEEEWEECFLSDILEFKNGLNPKANKFGKGTKFISVMDILNNIFITYDCIKATVEATEEEKLNFSVEKGDILFQRSSETLDDVGRANVYMDERPAIFGGFVIRGKKKGEYNPLFFRYLLSSPCSRRKIIPMGAGAQHFNIGQEGLSKVKLNFASLSEQGKIGKFLSLIDERIATQNKIIEELKQLKNGISLNLFTNRIIFDKQITLSKCGTLRNGYAFKSSTYNLKGKYSIITIANVTGSRYIESVDCNKVTQIPEDIQSHQILSNGDILISLTGNVGRVSLCTDGHFLLNQRVGLFELSDSIDKEFIYQVLSSKHFENEMIAKGQGAAQMNINKNDVESYVIPYSTNLQNIRIVLSLLKSLDEKILTMEHLLLSYNKQKTYLLRQMFI